MASPALGLQEIAQPQESLPDSACKEAQKWIEQVTGRSFGDKDFRTGLENGILLCELLNAIKPGLVKKINRLPTPIAGLDNITLFLRGCKELGLKESQLFDPGDLQDTSNRTVRTTDCTRKLRNVLVTIYWLGKAANSCTSYSGNNLDLKEFEGMLAQIRKENEEIESPKRSIRDSGYIDCWDSERSDSLSPPRHGRDDSFDSLDSFGSRSQQTPSPDVVLRGSSDGRGSDSESDLPHRRLPDVRKDDMSARRVSFGENKAFVPFNQYLPNKNNQTAYIPAPLRKKKAEREDCRRSWSTATSPLGGERPFSQSQPEVIKEELNELQCAEEGTKQVVLLQDQGVKTEQLHTVHERDAKEQAPAGQGIPKEVEEIRRLKSLEHAGIKVMPATKRYSSEKPTVEEGESAPDIVLRKENTFLTCHEGMDLDSEEEEECRVPDIERDDLATRRARMNQRRTTTPFNQYIHGSYINKTRPQQEHFRSASPASAKKSAEKSVHRPYENKDDLTEKSITVCKEKTLTRPADNEPDEELEPERVLDVQKDDLAKRKSQVVHSPQKEPLVFPTSSITKADMEKWQRLQLSSEDSEHLKTEQEQLSQIDVCRAANDDYGRRKLSLQQKRARNKQKFVRFGPVTEIDQQRWDRLCIAKPGSGDECEADGKEGSSSDVLCATVTSLATAQVLENAITRTVLQNEASSLSKTVTAELCRSAGSPAPPDNEDDAHLLDTQRDDMLARRTGTFQKIARLHPPSPVSHDHHFHDGHHEQKRLKIETNEGKQDPLQEESQQLKRLLLSDSANRDLKANVSALGDQVLANLKGAASTKDDGKESDGRLEKGTNEPYPEKNTKSYNIEITTSVLNPVKATNAENKTNEAYPEENTISENLKQKCIPNPVKAADAQKKANEPYPETSAILVNLEKTTSIPNPVKASHAEKKANEPHQEKSTIAVNVQKDTVLPNPEEATHEVYPETATATLNPKKAAYAVNPADTNTLIPEKASHTADPEVDTNIPNPEKDDMMVRRISVTKKPVGIGQSHFLPVPFSLQHKEEVKSSICLEKDKKMTSATLSNTIKSNIAPQAFDIPSKPLYQNDKEEHTELKTDVTCDQASTQSNNMVNPTELSSQPQETLERFSPRSALSDDAESMSMCDMRYEEDGCMLPHSRAHHENLQNVNDLLKEEDDTWQDDLARWKTRRRSASQDLIKKEQERKKMERLLSGEEDLFERRKSIKTYKEIVEEKERREKELHEAYKNAKSKEEAEKILQKYIERFTISEAVLEQLMMPKILEKSHSVETSLLTSSDPNPLKYLRQQSLPTPKYTATVEATISPSSKSDSKVLTNATSPSKNIVSKTVPMLTAKPYTQPKNTQQVLKTFKVDGKANMNGETINGMEEQKESVFGKRTFVPPLTRSQRFEGIARVDAPVPEVKQDIACIELSLSKSHVQNSITALKGFSQETNHTSQEDEMDSSPKNEFVQSGRQVPEDNTQAPNMTQDVPVVTSLQFTPSVPANESALNGKISEEERKVEAKELIMHWSLDTDIKEQKDSILSPFKRVPEGEQGFSQKEHYGEAECSENSPALIPTLNSPNRLCSWDPEEERRRQERWQQEQERMLQERYQKEQEKLKDEWEKAQKEVEEEERKYYEEERKIIEDTVVPLTFTPNTSVPISGSERSEKSIPVIEEHDQSQKENNNEKIWTEPERQLNDGTQEQDGSKMLLLAQEGTTQRAEEVQTKGKTNVSRLETEQSMIVMNKEREQENHVPANDCSTTTGLTMQMGDQHVMSSEKSLPEKDGSPNNYIDENIVQQSMSSTVTRGTGSQGGVPCSSPSATSQCQSPNRSVSGKKLCSTCGCPLGKGAAMIIETLSLYFHIQCFKCGICKEQLGDATTGTDVRIRNGLLNCNDCYMKSRTAGHPTPL